MTLKRRPFVNIVTISGNLVLVQPTVWFWAQLPICERYSLIVNFSILTNILFRNKILLYLPRQNVGSTNGYESTRLSIRSKQNLLRTKDSIPIQKKTLKYGSTNTIKCLRGSRSSTPKISLISTKQERGLGVLDLRI